MSLVSFQLGLSTAKGTQEGHVAPFHVSKHYMGDVQCVYIPVQLWGAVGCFCFTSQQNNAVTGVCDMKWCVWGS